MASNNEPLHVVAAVRELAALEGDRVGGGVLGLVSGLRKEEKSERKREEKGEREQREGTERRKKRE